MTNVEQLLRPEPKRDRYGRYLIGGKPYTRVTTFAASIDDRFNLEAWKVRMAASGLVARPDLFAQVAAHVDDKKRLDALCNDAIEAAKGSAGANLGTALHAFSEQIDLGLTPIIPDPWNADIAAYTAALQANGVRVDREYVERIVVRHDLGIAGTFDRLVTVDGFPLPVIADLKTGNLEHASAFGAIAVQLACYAHADDLYDPTTDSLAPMPPVDKTRALVIHLPAGKATCTLHLVDLTAGWEAAQLCGAVREWRKRKNLAARFTTTFDQRSAWAADRVRGLATDHPDALQALAAAWPAGVPTFKQGGPRDDAELDLIVAAVTKVEAAHHIPFGAADPTDTRPNDLAVAVMVARLEALAPEVLAAVREVASNCEIPNVKSRKFTVAHLELLDEIVVDAEKAAAKQSATTAA